MFDFAWSEIALTGLVAVLVLGPKELPSAMRALGRFTRQARKLAGEFRGHVDDLVREAELDEVRNSVQRISSPNIKNEIGSFLDPGGDFATEMAKTEQEMQAALSATPAPVPAPATVTPTDAVPEVAGETHAPAARTPGEGVP